MGQIKIQNVVSFSSEDPNHPAENLLLKEGAPRKWLCKRIGEARAWVELQLERACTISHLEICNCGSTFIQVLVGLSGCPEVEFKVLLDSSTFMSPVDCRNKMNMERVRIFHSWDFNKEIQSQKWDRIRVCCTQPFNKHMQYGISSITVHEHEENPVKRDAGAINKKLNKLGAASQIQIISKSLAGKKIKRSPEKEHPKDCDDPHPIPEKASNPVVLTPKSKEPIKTPKRKIPVHSEAKSFSPTQGPFKRARKMKPFNKLLEGVVAVLSGQRNPLRTQLIEKLRAMGAKYKTDWGPGCTHLICALCNTPKFLEVKGKGKIVTADWVENCFRKRKRLPWRRFCLDKADKEEEESEDEIWEGDEQIIPAP